MESYSGINITRSFSLKPRSRSRGAVTPHDRLLFDIRDNNVRERLLRETGLTLRKTDEICRASKSMQKQMKVVESNKGVQSAHCTAQAKVEKKPARRKKNSKATICARKRAETMVNNMT